MRPDQRRPDGTGPGDHRVDPRRLPALTRSEPPGCPGLPRRPPPRPRLRPAADLVWPSTDHLQVAGQLVVDMGDQPLEIVAVHRGVAKAAAAPVAVRVVAGTAHQAQVTVLAFIGQREPSDLAG